MDATITDWYDLLVKVTGQNVKIKKNSQPGWHKLQTLHAETSNLARTNILMNSDCTPKTTLI